LANEAGLFRDEGLQVEIVRMAGAVSPMALISGDTDFATMSAFLLIPVSVRNQEVVMLGGLTRYAAMTLVSRPEIRTAKDLMGGVIGLQRPGDAYEKNARSALQHLKLNPDKDVKFLYLGTNEAMWIALDARKLGHVGVFLRPNPNREGSWFCDGSYDRLWAALQDLDLAVGFHPYLMPDMPGAVRQLGLNNFVAPGAKTIMEMTADIDQIADGTYGNKNIFFTQALGNVFDMQIALTMLICGGVLERFPRLRCIFLEANGGWIVPILERLDHHYEIFRWEVPQLTMKPSEYFKRQCWISFDPDESTLKLTAESPLVGADRIIWASDYPHPDAKIPGVVGELREQMKGLPDASQRRIFGLNAVDLYGLPEPN